MPWYPAAAGTWEGPRQAENQRTAAPTSASSSPRQHVSITLILKGMHFKMQQKRGIALRRRWFGGRRVEVGEEEEGGGGGGGG